MLGAVCVAAATAVTLIACETEAEAVAAATGALDTAPVEEVPLDAPVVVDVASVDQAAEALASRLAVIDDPEARLTARFEEFRKANAELPRGDGADLRSLVATGAAIRARLLDTPEAIRDGEQARRARAERGEVFAPTRADLAAFAAARAHMDARIGAHPVVPEDQQTPEGTPTPGSMNTEVLGHGTR